MPNRHRQRLVNPLLVALLTLLVASFAIAHDGVTAAPGKTGPATSVSADAAPRAATPFSTPTGGLGPPADTSTASAAGADSLTQNLRGAIAEYRAAAPAERGRLGESLVAIAAARREALLSLMETDPSAVLDVALSDADTAGLPSPVAAYIEREAAISGSLEIRHEDASTGSRYRYYVRSNDRRYSVYFAQDSPEHLSTGATVRLKGVRIDDRLAAGSGSDVQVVTAAPASATLGAQRTLVMLVTFSDTASEPYTAAYAQSVLFGTTSSFFQENSYQQTSLVGDVVGWYTVSLSSTVCDVDALESQARTAASSAGVDLASYAHLVYAFPRNACGWWGLSTVGGNPSHSDINGSLELGVTAHELGHAQGLWHSHSLDCGTATVVGANCSVAEYGDIIDMMGSSTSAHYNAFQKERLGWLNSGASPPVTTVVADGTYTIAPYETLGTAPKALKVLKSTDPNTGQRTWYYVEYRQAVGFDAFLSSPSVGVQNVTSGVLVHIGAEGNGNTGSLLDMTPSTVMYYWWYDPALTAGQTFVDPDTGASITTSWVGSSGAGVTVKLGQTVSSAPAVAVMTNQSSYTRGQTASITAKVTAGGSPVAKAGVSFTVIKANGTKVAGSATTGSSGTAVYKLRISKSDPVGNYQADASTTVAGLAKAAATTFVVQ